MSGDPGWRVGFLDNSGDEPVLFTDEGSFPVTDLHPDVQSAVEVALSVSSVTAGFLLSVAHLETVSAESVHDFLEFVFDHGRTCLVRDPTPGQEFLNRVMTSEEFAVTERVRDWLMQYTTVDEHAGSLFGVGYIMWFLVRGVTFERVTAG